MTDTFTSPEQVRQFGEQATETTRALSRQFVDAYERAVTSVVDVERAAAAAAPVDWVKTALGAHASFVADLNAAYVSAARSVLN
jgi:hypothetical protein